MIVVGRTRKVMGSRWMAVLKKDFCDTKPETW
jgi:hypothetical protein